MITEHAEVGQTSVANQGLKSATVAHSSAGINLIREDVAGRQARELRSPNDDAPHLADLLQGSRYTIETWPRILPRRSPPTVETATCQSAAV